VSSEEVCTCVHHARWPGITGRHITTVILITDNTDNTDTTLEIGDTASEAHAHMWHLAIWHLCLTEYRVCVQK